MAKKVISYKLNLDGTIPDYVEDGGYLPKNPNNTTEMVLIGISKDDADISNALSYFATEEDLVFWLNTYLSDNIYIDNEGNEKQFTIVNAAKEIFAKIN